ncbi:hypothetical protein Rta_30910 [Ramlibacter tataouinensis TTB310]|uniref:Uncharacterized protein n=1 Tax=Ramlibacter tataouinensis (strain ATCC BAA-407 / DSM 14655 / LMG 21543 / TTB310) TaxID=365046 RepID=F5XWQ7_RAMTT|nr:hypothetical protein Rta_30910 [Ramlibacter tataouinensis TTB310]
MTDFTSLTLRAISLARDLAAALGAVPLSVTTPSRVSTSICVALRFLSAARPLLTLVVIWASSTLAPTRSPAACVFSLAAPAAPITEVRASAVASLVLLAASWVADLASADSSSVLFSIF